MPWTAMTAASAGVAYTAADFNKIVDNLTWLYAQRSIPLAGYDQSVAAWAIAAGAGAFEADGDAANFKVAITNAVTCSFFAVGVVRWSSDTARDSSLKMQLEITDGVTPANGDDNGYQGTSNVGNKECYIVTGSWAAKAADTWTVTMRGARNNADDTVTIVDRSLIVFAFAD